MSHVPLSTPCTEADLPIDASGRIYHLQITPEQLAPDILLVGDPGRAEFIARTFLHDLEVEQEHRGLVTATGISCATGDRATIISPGRTTVATSGMGTPSLEIVLNELVALNEIDFSTRAQKATFPRLHVIRVGTSGGLQASTRLGTSIITTYAVGMDNTGLFYETPCPDQTCARLEQELAEMVKNAANASSRFRGKIHPYVSRAEPAVVRALTQAAKKLGVAARTGLTVSNSGFFAPQGRDISRLRPSTPDLDRMFSQFDPGLGGQRVENMEMEASFLLHFLGGLGHWGGAICPVIANRRDNTFDHEYLAAVESATKTALLALATLRSLRPDSLRP
ncbi:MAG: nucleoside phosphorylase [Desulfomicrobium sp.]|nr:nucleoside phosphorylase [Pseudomonadota bacterium]MBV1711505.1 nucleoside phosphorylase [Desulfomicrobium sp.]MBU4572918.1 nucleoside phosphorylase [Pseudomonadota bacterium]MBU4594646.1 nucleoside phosphorylase [Pseudomonadota bacterium]MBV1718782.1 nucleoside phosphorylase [Desulfomicrobium sp.]